MMTAGAGGTYYFHYIASPGRGGHGFLSLDNQNRATYPPQYLAAQVIAQEWVQPVDKIHKLYKAASNVLDKNGHELITAYPVVRPDGQWSVMLINKDENNGHSVRVAFYDPAIGQKRFFTGTVDRVVFGPAEYQWHPDPPATADATQPTGDGGQDDNAPPSPARGHHSGHAAPDGPASKSTVTAVDADTLYDLPGASIVVLRGHLGVQWTAFH
jgi:hypothetical protein